MDWLIGSYIVVILLLSIVALTYYAAWRIQVRHNQFLEAQLVQMEQRVNDLTNDLFAAKATAQIIYERAKRQEVSTAPND